MPRLIRGPHPGSALVLVACLVGAFAPPAQAIVVSGFVKSAAGGAPVANVDLDWFNQDLGIEIDPVGDLTDATGFFSVDVPAGKYDITVNRPLTLDHASVLLTNVDLQSPTTLPDTFLQPGALLTAFFTDELANPLLGIRVAIRDEDTGDDVFLANRNSDSTGVFSDVVPFGTHRITITDPTNTYVPPFPLEDFVMSAPVDLGTIVMPLGTLVTGSVTDDLGAAIFNVDLDVYDEAGTLIYTPNDNTDFFGVYSVLLPNGLVRIEFTPAPGSPFAAEFRDGVAVPGAPAPVVLADGVSISGSVLDATSLPLPGVDIDVIDPATGIKRFVPGDFTDALGHFAILLPNGTFDIVYNPPGPGLASGVLWDRIIVGPAALPTVQLQAGVVVSGTVTGGGSPLAGVDLDFVLVSNGKTYPTPADDTDALGLYSVRVPAGTFDVNADPGVASGYVSATAAGQVMTGPTVLNFTLDLSSTAAGDPELTPQPVTIRVAPNPFRGSARLLLAAEPGERIPDGPIEILDVRGRVVRTLDPLLSGERAWDGRDAQGRNAPPGVYFFVLGAAGTARAVKLQ